MGWIYLAESEEIHSDSEAMSKPLHTVRQTDTLKLSSYHACQMEASDQRQYGTTSKPSVEACSTSQSTSLSQGFPVKTYPVQAVAQVWKEGEADFIGKCIDWSKNSHPLSSFWKTSQPSALEDFEKSSAHLSIFGMTVDGLVYLPQKLEPSILENAGSYWPTPTKEDYRRRGPSSRQQGLPEKIHNLHGGQLNPTWVEWLMGFPLEWSALSDLGMQWYRSKRKQHLKGCYAEAALAQWVEQNL